MARQAHHPDHSHVSVDYPYTARAKAAQSGEHTSRWLITAAIIAAAAIFWTLAAEAFTSV